MFYFDNAATGGTKPDSVLSATTAAMKICANPGRGGHSLALACAKTVEHSRRALCELFDGYTTDRIIFTKNCTEALNLALLGTLRRGDHAIATCMEHNSVLRPLERLKKAGLITYDICPLHGDGANANVRTQDIMRLVKPNTKLVAVTTASNVTGTAPPIERLRALLPDRILLLCDGAQGAGHLLLRMQTWGIDMLTLAGHKGMLGIQGSGALLFSPRVDPTPLLYGGTGSMSISLDMPDFYPDALEAGTLAFPAIVSLLEGARHLQVKQDEIAQKCTLLTDYLLRGLQDLTTYVAYSQPNPCGIVAFRHKRLQSEYIASALSTRYSIAVRGGLHCAPLMHAALGTAEDGLVRASFSHFNSQTEIDALLAALKELQTR